MSVLTTACAGSQFDGTEYRDDDMAFRLGPVPEGARQIDSSESLVAFRNDEASTTIAVSGRCGLDGDDVPLEAHVQHLFLQFTNRQVVSQRKLRLDGRAALETELDASLDGVNEHFVVVVLKKDGCVYDFIHVDPGGNEAATQRSRRDFRTMVQGFRTIE